ncbi:hypothetical protein DPMN_098873 [Dreissena polymorpha]|uniref:Uncharacterized protein n=1 Tax=Dreissena polymorpha TaxID=45954 RepID=A0A9D4LFI2_DREPO|nr:hypothetical protein DPMN_098873 [Dreissena polymorpha]
MRAASATPAKPDPGSGISGSEDSSASSSGTASRIGGNATQTKQQETSLKLNRFLALSGYTEGAPIDSVLGWKGEMKVHDDYFLTAGHTPGTLRSALLAIRPFIKWCMDVGRASREKAEAVSFNVAFYCIMSIYVSIFTMHYSHVHSIIIKGVKISLNEQRITV